MARYTGPTTKIARKFGEPIFGADKDFEKTTTNKIKRAVEIEKILQH